MDISISEVTQFLRCRRKWDINSPNRQALKPIALPRAVLSIGTFIHTGIAAQAQGKYFLDAMRSEYESEHDKFVNAYIDQVGVGPDESELVEFNEQYEIAVQVVSRYLDKYNGKPTGDYEMLYTEQTFRVPIPSTDNFLVGTFDRIMRAPNGDIVVGEIKTYDRRPNFESLQFRPQFVAYSWAVSQLMGTNEFASYFLYDGISRKLPKAPAILKNGSLSKAWSDSLDYATYVEAIEQNGLDINDYSDILTRIQGRDATENPFYTRYIIPITKGQVDSFVNQLTNISHEMNLIANMNEPNWLYPNFQMTCPWDCNVQSLCSAMQNGEDVSSIIATSYYQNTGNRTFQSRDGDEVEFTA